MTKIKCLNTYGPVSSQQYTTPKGNVYEFTQGIFTDVPDPEDALHFLKAGNGEIFVAKEGVLKDLVKKLEAAIKKLHKKDKVDEEHPPAETGAIEPTAADLAAADGETAPIDDNEGPANGEDEVDLESMTKKELDDYAKTKGVELDRRRKKADMIADFKKKISE